MKRNKRIFIVLIFILSIIGSLIVSAESDQTSVNFEELHDLVQESGGIPEFEVPTPAFTLTTEDGQSFPIYPIVRGEYDRLKDPNALYKMPITGTIPAGSTIRLEDNSIPGEKGPINKRDWQISHMDMSKKNRNLEKFSGKGDQHKNLTTKVQENGYLAVFLNVSDSFKVNYKGTDKPMIFENWSNLGNWRTQGRTLDGGFEVNEWFFTAAIFKISTDMGMAEPVELIDKNGQSVEKYTEGEEYRLRFNVEHVAGQESIGSLDPENPYATIGINVQNIKNRIFWSQLSLSTNKVLEKGQVLEMPLSDIFKPESEKIRVCGYINGIHKENGQNDNDKNDVICKEFEAGDGVAGNDMGMNPGVKFLDGKGNEITQYQKGSTIKVVFPVDHVSGGDIVGDGTPENPYTTVDLTVKDEKGKVIKTEKIQTNKPLKPGETISLPESKPFESNSEYIEVCGTINKIHKDLGYNEDIKNDTICVKLYPGDTDIGMSNGVKLYNNKGEQINNYKKGEALTVVFPVKHISGSKSVGDGTAKNPYIKIKTDIRNSNKITLNSQSVQANKPLQPKSEIDMPKTNSFSTNEDFIVACATIDPQHKELGYNDNPANDTICIRFDSDEVDIAVDPDIILLNSSGQRVTNYKRGEQLRVVFPVKHIKGESSVGDGTVKNPYIKIRTSLEDRDKKALTGSGENIQATKTLKPKSVMGMPATKVFTTNSDLIKVCATIDPQHKALGYNSSSHNDTACKTFKADGVNLAMAEPVTLGGGYGGKFLNPENRNHTLQFRVLHESGDRSVGGAADNPYVKIHVLVTDAQNRQTRRTVMTNSVLHKGQTISMPVVDGIDGSSGAIKACAVIDPEHAKLGFNSNPDDDGICASFIASKNYAVKNVVVNPQFHHLAEKENYFETPVTVNFDLINESLAGDGNLPSNVLVRVREGSKVVHEASYSVPAGSRVSQSVSLKSKRYTAANTVFNVEINPVVGGSRQYKEFRPGGNPYGDNIEYGSLTLKRWQTCIDCQKEGSRLRNTWSEEFRFVEQFGTVRTASATDVRWDYCTEELYDKYTGRYYTSTYKCNYEYQDYTYQYCQVNRTDRYEKIKQFYEEYGIEKVEFRSKWSKDVRGGWIDLLKGPGYIKAGNGFELRITTKYETNRTNLPPPNPYRRNYYPSTPKPFGGSHSGGYCDWLTRWPSVSSVSMPNQIYMTLNYNTGDICYILSGSSSGSWSNQTMTHQLPLRSDIGDGSERKIYIPKNAVPGSVIRIDSIITPAWNGYRPDNPVDLSNKKTLQDCKYGLRIIVLPQDDLKDHIMK